MAKVIEITTLQTGKVHERVAKIVVLKLGSKEPQGATRIQWEEGTECLLDIG